MKLVHEPLELSTQFEFRIAVGARTRHVNTLVRIEHDGIVGLGEAAPSHYYAESEGNVRVALDTWAPHLGDALAATSRIAQEVGKLAREPDVLWTGVTAPAGLSRPVKSGCLI